MIRAVAILVVGTLFFSALLTPPIFSLLLNLWPEMPWPFSRVFDRVAMLVILIFIILYRKQFPLHELKGYFTRKRFQREYPLVLTGVFIAATVSLLVLPAMVGTGQLEWNDRSVNDYLMRFLKVLPTALVVSLIEEGFFRGLLFTQLKRAMPLALAIIVCSLLYSFAHFITPAKEWVYTGLSLTIGFEYLFVVVERALLPGILPAFFGLFLVGVVLCIVLERSKSLLVCIGLHTGWVIAIKFASFSTQTAAGFNFPSGAGRRYFLVMSPMTWFIILLIGAIMLVLWRYFQRGSENTTGSADISKRPTA